jgi:hypothetical protein
LLFSMIVLGDDGVIEKTVISQSGGAGPVKLVN